MTIQNSKMLSQTALWTLLFAAGGVDSVHILCDDNQLRGDAAEAATNEHTTSSSVVEEKFGEQNFRPFHSPLQIQKELKVVNLYVGEDR